MNNVTREQIERAKSLDLLSFLQAHEPGNIHRDGSEYRLRDHDSLTISNGKFHWRSRGVGGSNCIDYLMKVRGMGFVEAVQTVVGASAPSYSIAQPQECKPRTFALPACNSDNDRVIAYLRQRGIGLQTIRECIENGSLYEDTRRNCVFVGFDAAGSPRYATLRGTYGDFKCDVAGSNKRFGFIFPPVDRFSPVVAVFESPIDTLAHATLRPFWDGYRLSLGGVSLTALVQFLANHPEVEFAEVCTDNDEAGNACAAQITGLRKRIRTTRSKPPRGKDWADCLK